MLAALDAGADAVYGGLPILNARRGAANFAHETLVDAVKMVHQRSARFHLTLNTDLAQRELGQAVRCLELARQCGVDAVLIRDPALIGLISMFPELEFHFSTQTCIANSADVKAARELGARRCVLAREMTLAEITAASAVPGIETEVFCQGALCYSVSGRCLMSSWAGGRSGNRGTCTSPCRVPWRIDGRRAGTPLSMRDLATLRRIRELCETRTASLKIEGRLRKPEWVAAAVALYRRALDGESPKELYREARDGGTLSAATGRTFTWGYLDGERTELTGLAAGRMAADGDEVPGGDADDGIEKECAADECGVNGDDHGGSGTEDEPNDVDSYEDFGDDFGGGDGEATENAIAAGSAYAIDFDLTDGRFRCTCRCGDRTETWDFPRSVVRRAARAVTLGQVLQYLEVTPVQGVPLVEGTTTDDEFAIMPRTMNTLVDRITKTIHLSRKPSDDRLRIELPAPLMAELERMEPTPENANILGTPPDRLRIEVTRAMEPIRSVRPAATILEGVTAASMAKVRELARLTSPIVALPPVFFEEDIHDLREVCERCARDGIVVEVNSWGGWWLAKDADAVFEAGPGLGVLNAMAAARLGQLGCRAVTLSVEADRGQLEAMTACCPVPCSMVVYSRPVLVTTRVRMPDETLRKTFRDRGEIEMMPRVERRMTVFRPVQPMDLRDLVNDRLRAAHFIVDLVGSPDPLADLFPTEDESPRRRRRADTRKTPKTHRFNYFRELK